MKKYVVKGEHEAEMNELTGRNLLRMRTFAGLSMKELAERMREHGYGWKASTVLNAEHGGRTLKLAEATALVDILGGYLPQLYTGDEAPVVVNAVQDLQELRLRLLECADMYADTYDKLRALLGKPRYQQAYVEAYGSARSVPAPIQVAQQALARLVPTPTRKGVEESEHAVDETDCQH